MYSRNGVIYMDDRNDFKNLLVKNEEISEQLVKRFELMINQEPDDSINNFINEIKKNKFRLKELNHLKNLISKQIMIQRKEEEKLLNKLDIPQNWKLIESSEDIITVESENVIYSLAKYNFNISMKNKNIKESIFSIIDLFENAHESINIKELKNFKQSIKNGNISLDQFKWLNTWIVTKGKSWGHGKLIANKLSRLLFGLDEIDLPRLAGKENKRNFELPNSYIYSELYKIISNKFQ